MVQEKQVLLKDGRNPNTYIVLDNIIYSLCERGSIRVSGEVEGNYVVYWKGQHETSPEIRHSVTILGMTPDEEKVPDKTYECAVQYCQDLAETHGVKLINETRRAKESGLKDKTTIVQTL